MTFKFCDAPLLNNYISLKHINVLVAGSSTECPTILTNCLIIFRMKSIPRVNWSISMPPTSTVPIPLHAPEESEKAQQMSVSLSPGFFTGSDETVCSLPSSRLLDIINGNCTCTNGGRTVSSWREIILCSWWRMNEIMGDL